MSIKEGELIKIQFRLSKIFKIIDAFSNKIIDDAVVDIVGEKTAVLSKKNGFYVFSNLENREYTVNISCKGFKEKTVTFFPDGDSEIAQLIMLIPSDEAKMRVLFGTLKEGRKKAALKKFYYAVCVKEFSVTISGNFKKEDSFIKIQAYDKIFLEGRMFATENNEKEVITLGSYDFIGKKYKTENNASNDISIGETAYLLFEGETDENSCFEIYIPKIFGYDSFEMLFILGEKSCQLEIGKKDEIKVNVRS